MASLRVAKLVETRSQRGPRRPSQWAWPSWWRRGPKEDRVALLSGRGQTGGDAVLFGIASPLRQEGRPQLLRGVPRRKHFHSLLPQEARDACWLGRVWRAKRVTLAASAGNLLAVKWLRAANYSWTNSTCVEAALGGHLAVLRWCLSNGCPADKRVCKAAAKHGDLEALKLARANGCPWSKSVCVKAAERGHLHVLKWALANGCPETLWPSAIFPF